MTHSYRFPSIQGVISHLQNAHNMEIGYQTHSLDNFTKFNEWKIQEEKTSKSYYIQNSSAKLYGSTKYWYLYCNRYETGHFRGEGKRLTKSQGSCKTGK